MVDRMAKPVRGAEEEPPPRFATYPEDGDWTIGQRADFDVWFSTVQEGAIVIIPNKGVAMHFRRNVEAMGRG